MKKIYCLFLLFIAFFALALTSCGPKPNPDSDIENNGGSGSEVDTATLKQRVKDSIGTNFIITIQTLFSTETIIRSGDSFVSKLGNMETLYHDGASYFRMSSSASFMLSDELPGYNAQELVWNETNMDAVLLMYYKGYDFDSASGWTSESLKYLDRNMTKYTLASSAEVYIDDETGATFKFVGLNEGTALGNFEVTSFTKGTADLSSYILAISK